MASKQADTVETGVYHDGTEVAVRSTSQHSNGVHIPQTDADGNVEFDDDGDPIPQCKTQERESFHWKLKSVRHLTGRFVCRKCDDPDEVSDQNSVNGASKTFARIARHGNDWGDDTEQSSANTSQSSGD